MRSLIFLSQKLSALRTGPRSKALGQHGALEAEMDLVELIIWIKVPAMPYPSWAGLGVSQHPMQHFTF